MPMKCLPVLMAARQAVLEPTKGSHNIPSKREQLDAPIWKLYPGMRQDNTALADSGENL
jgi:hypothetical protein